MGQLFDLEAEGYFYSRLQNPTCDMVAAKICALEGGTAAMLTSSGQAANFFALFNLASNGDHIVASSSIYGGTFNLISVTMAKWAWRRRSLRRLLSRAGAGSSIPPEYEGGLWRDHCKPGADGAGHRALCRRRAPARGASGGGQYVCNTDQLPTDCVGARTL